jgi:hypothetical protein
MTDEAAAEQTHEVAPLELEGIAAGFRQLVAFGFHHRPPIGGELVRMRSAARRTAWTIRG